MRFPADFVIYYHSKKFNFLYPFNSKSLYLDRYIFVLLPNIMNFVLLTFIDNLFLSNQLFILISSEVILSKSCCRFSPEPIIFVSSANKMNLSNWEVLQMSLIYIINSLGPSTEPWGKPHKMSSQLESVFSILTNCFLSVK